MPFGQDHDGAHYVEDLLIILFKSFQESEKIFRITGNNDIIRDLLLKRIRIIGKDYFLNKQ